MPVYKYCPTCSEKLLARVIGGADRLVCSSPQCNFIYWNNPVPVVAIIVQHGDHVVLARNAAWQEGMFSIITGYLEQNETPEQCALRETKEELNLDAESAEFVGVYPFTRQNQILIAYAVNAIGNIRLNEELVEYKLIPKEKLKGWDFGTGLAVSDWVKKQ